MEVEKQSVFWLIIIGATLSAAKYHICPHNKEIREQHAFGLLSEDAKVQQGIWHKIPCLAYRPGEELDGIIWYKGSRIDDLGTQRLISRKGADYFPTTERYAFSSDESSLLIKGVEKTDEGTYLCQVIPENSLFRAKGVHINVIADSFPAVISDTSTSARLGQGSRQLLPCQCAEQVTEAISVVYWSAGNGVIADTEIIGARFSDGTFIQTKYGTDCNIDSDASLIVNCPHAFADVTRLWCHVFLSNGTQRNCHTDLSFAETFEASPVMKATETAFYLQKGREQTLPCVDKTPGEKSCNIRWMQDDKDSGRQILHYQVFNNHITAEPTFHLAVDFGLTIKSVQDNHTGRYTCSRGAGNPYTIISAFVIGDSFPLDDKKSIAADQVTFEPGQRFELPCPAKSNLSETTKATLVWSYGTSDKRSPTVIGTRNLPDGSKSMSDLGGKRCFDIASNGSLLSNCSDEDDVRYWCHVFPHDSLLRRSHVDVSFHTQNTTPNSAQVPCMRLHVAGVIIACEMMIRLVLSWNNLT